MRLASRAASWWARPKLVVEGLRDDDVTKVTVPAALSPTFGEASRGWHHETGLVVPHETGSPCQRDESRRRAGGRAREGAEAGVDLVCRERGAITDVLLEWPPDLFVLANVVLARAEGFRFALSPGRSVAP